MPDRPVRTGRSARTVASHGPRPWLGFTDALPIVQLMSDGRYVEGAGVELTTRALFYSEIPTHEPEGMPHPPDEQ